MFGQQSRRSNLRGNNQVEPMDTSSGNTILNNNSKPKFVSQELYNQEVLQYTPEITAFEHNENNPNNFSMFETNPSTPSELDLYLLGDYSDNNCHQSNMTNFSASSTIPDFSTDINYSLDENNLCEQSTFCQENRNFHPATLTAEIT